MVYWFPFLIMILGMWGGQKTKSVRREGIALSSVLVHSIITTIENKKLDKSKKSKRVSKYLILLILSPLLRMGYGENSKLMKVFKYDWLVRIVYGALLGLPFLVWNIWYAPIVLACAWSVRAGSLGTVKIGKKDYDILIEDMVRYFSLGVIISLI